MGAQNAVPRRRRLLALTTILVVLLSTALALGAPKAKRPKPHGKLGKAHAAMSAPAAPTAPPAPAPPTWSTEEFDKRKDARKLEVVGVYRPVEMAGRTVSVPREIYLQAIDGKGERLKDLVGKVLEVHRSVPVPTAVPQRGGPSVPSSTAILPSAIAPATPPSKSAPVAPAPPIAAPAPVSAAPASAAPATALGAVARLKAMKKAAEEAKAAGAAAPAAPAAPPSVSAPKTAPSAAPSSPAPGSAAAPSSEATPSAPPVPPVPEVLRPRPQPLPSVSMDVLVGRVQVVEIRGQVAVARVADDGIGKPEGGDLGGVPAELPAIMAGDFADLVIAPAPPPLPPPPAPPLGLSKAEQSDLEAARRAMEAENWRRKHPRGKYERKVMKWKL